MQRHLGVAESKLQLHVSQTAIGCVGELGGENGPRMKYARASTMAAR